MSTLTSETIQLCADAAKGAFEPAAIGFPIQRGERPLVTRPNEANDLKTWWAIV